MQIMDPSVTNLHGATSDLLTPRGFENGTWAEGYRRTVDNDSYWQVDSRYSNCLIFKIVCEYDCRAVEASR